MPQSWAPISCPPTGACAAWLARLSGGQEVPGSNPGAPTNRSRPLALSDTSELDGDGVNGRPRRRIRRSDLEDGHVLEADEEILRPEGGDDVATRPGGQDLGREDRARL